MNPVRMLVREIAYRRLNALLTLAAVAAAAATATAVVGSLRAQGRQLRAALELKARETERIMADVQEEMRKATLKLSFNLLILPRDQNLQDWYAKDYGEKLMPEEYADRLARSDTVVIQHILPSLQRRVLWPERNRTIILVGTRGEATKSHRNPKKPLLDAVPRGRIVLGHELHTTLGLKPGDPAVLLGRSFTVERCHEERGNRDDVTAWIHLAEAQELLDCRGRINAILALECVCAGKDSALSMVRRDLAAVLPDTQVIERGGAALARAEARTRVGDEAEAALERERATGAEARAEAERLAMLLLPAAIAGSALCVALLAFVNVRDRRSEVGILRALGWRTGRIMMLFLAKLAALGALGGIAGVAAGAVFICPRDLHAGWEDIGPALAGAVVLAAAGLSLLAGWLPVLAESLRDPAESLRLQEG